VGVQELWWIKRGSVRAGIIIVSMERVTSIINWEQEFCTLQNSISG